MTFGKALLRILNLSVTIMFWVCAVFGLFRLGQYSYDFGFRVFTEPAMTSEENAKDKVVTIKDSMDEYEIGQVLEKKGLVKDARLFAVQLKLSAYDDDIQPGTYTLSTSMTAKEMMAVMSKMEIEETEDEEE